MGDRPCQSCLRDVELGHPGDVSPHHGRCTLVQLRHRPELLLRLSRVFGPEVEDYRNLLTLRSMAHEKVPEIFLVTNMVPGARPPLARPEPPLTAEGKWGNEFYDSEEITKVAYQLLIEQSVEKGYTLLYGPLELEQKYAKKIRLA